MMHIGPVEADTLSLWKFTALRWKWNQRHKPEGEGADVAPPSMDRVERAFAKTRLN